MRLTEAPRYLLDVNVLVALASTTHEHHPTAAKWFDASPGIRWAVCAFTEAGFIRTMTAPRPGQITFHEATTVLAQFTKDPGYHYIPITKHWNVLCSPFFKRLFGTKQVTDAYLLGLAVKENLVLVTLDKGIQYLAGAEHQKNVLLLQNEAS
jgi:toxin-antitoxin system PIN domain toxin